MIDARSISRLESMATFALLQDVTAIIDVSITACGSIVPIDQAIGPAHIACSEVLGVDYPCHQ